MRRLLAAATLAAIGLTVAVPLASAHVDGTNHILEWGKSPDPTTASDGSQVWSNDEVIGARAAFKDGIKSWDVVVRPANGGQPSTCHEELARDLNRKPTYPQVVYINCPWDTTRAKNYTLPGPTPAGIASKPRPTSPDEPTRVWQSQDLGLSVNGKYTIEIRVWSAGEPYTCAIGLGTCNPDTPASEHQLYQDGTRWREVYVVNDVAAPGGVSSAFDPTTNRIGVTWAANPEPDATYVVQEKVGDGKWSSGVAVPANRYERTLDQAGKYQYRVAAVRPAPTRDSPNATKKSDYVAAAATDVAQITPPTTAGAAPNGADGAPDGGDPGVFVPTDPTSPTTAGGAAGAKPGKSNGSRPTGTTARPAGASSRPPRSTASQPGEAEGEGEDTGFSPTLPYSTGESDPLLADDDGLNDEGGVQTLAGGVVPRPRDTRQLMIFMAGALTLFVFAMQLTVLLRRSRPTVAAHAGTAGGGGATQQYHDDFDDWLGF